MAAHARENRARLTTLVAGRKCYVSKQFFSNENKVTLNEMNVLTKYKPLTNILISVGSGVISYQIYLAPDTFLLDKWRTAVASYRSASEVPVNEKVQQRFNEVLEDLKIPEQERTLLKPFTVFGFDTFHAGLLNRSHGAIIGIPPNFAYTRVQDVDHKKILINNEAVNWNDEAAEALLTTLVISENAQKFGIAREVLRVKYGEAQKNAIILGSVISVTLLIRSFVYGYYSFKHARRYVRYAFNCLLGAISTSVWIASKDVLSCLLDSKIDLTLSEIGADYVKGGKEYCEKLMIRNVCLRKLLGDQGAKKFSSTGNEEMFIRQKRVPLSQRRDFFDRKIRCIENLV